MRGHTGKHNKKSQGQVRTAVGTLPFTVPLSAHQRAFTQPQERAYRFLHRPWENERSITKEMMRKTRAPQEFPSIHCIGDPRNRDRSHIYNQTNGHRRRRKHPFLFAILCFRIRWVFPLIYSILPAVPPPSRSPSWHLPSPTHPLLLQFPSDRAGLPWGPASVACQVAVRLDASSPVRAGRGDQRQLLLPRSTRRPSACRRPGQTQQVP